MVAIALIGILNIFLKFDQKIVCAFPSIIISSRPVRHTSYRHQVVATGKYFKDNFEICFEEQGFRNCKDALRFWYCTSSGSQVKCIDINLKTRVMSKVLGAAHPSPRLVCGQSEKLSDMDVSKIKSILSSSKTNCDSVKNSEELFYMEKIFLDNYSDDVHSEIVTKIFNYFDV